MKAKKYLSVLALVLASSWAVAADAVPTAAIGTSAWTAPHNHAVAPTASTNSLTSSATAQRVGHSTTEESSSEGLSNGRLMLIGLLLMGVIALRSRKNTA